MLFSKDKNATPKPPSAVRKTIGMLVNPHLGSTVQALRETTNVFLHLLAQVFASQGMFPLDHPALRDVPGARLKLGEILGAAWNSITFTKQAIPQILLFMAVIASLGFSVLAVAVFLLTMFVGSAHAQTFASSCAGSGYFAPCDSVNDIALGWINYIFNAQPMTNYLSQYGQMVPQSQIIQQGLIKA